MAISKIRDIQLRDVSGMTRETITQASHGFTAGEAVFFNGSAWAKAKADVIADAEVVGVVESTKTDTFVVVYSGKISELSGLTPGAVYFLSETTAGALTTVEPSSEYVSKPLLVAITATTAIVHNWRGLYLSGAGAGGGGTSGYSGYSGVEGASGYSGYSGVEGTSGYSGYSGLNLEAWKSFVSTTDFSTTPPSTSTITMNTDQSSVLTVGTPVRYKVSGTYYYGIVKTCTANLLTVRGAPLTTGAGDLTELAYGQPGRTAQLDLYVSGAYADATSTTVFETKMKSRFVWSLPPAYMVFLRGRHNTNAGTTQPKMNFLVAGNRVSTNDTNLGIQLSTSVVENPDVSVNTTNYDVVSGDTVELECTAASNPTTGASDLTMTAMFVFA